MVIQLASSTPTLTTSSKPIPTSVGFIGSSDDAILVQSVMLNRTTDRLRDNFQRGLDTATQFIERMDELASKLEKLGKYVQANWVPVTYTSLQASNKDAASLRALFSKDGPNLGNSIDESLAALNELAADGITLNAPKQTPLMVEQFVAKDGKIDFTKAPSTGSIDWRSDQDMESVAAGSTPGTLPGSAVKTIETRDSNGKLISAIRYTIFNDYSNLRPNKTELVGVFSGYIEKMLPLLDDMASLLSQIAEGVGELDQRMRTESAKVKNDQERSFSHEQDKLVSTLEARRILKILFFDIGNAKRLLLDDKKYAAVDGAQKTASGSSATGRVAEDFKSNEVAISAPTNSGHIYPQYLLTEASSPDNPSDATVMPTVFTPESKEFGFEDAMSTIKPLLKALEKVLESPWRGSQVSSQA